MNIGFQGTIDYGGLGRFTTELVKELGPLCDNITVYPTAVSVEDPESHPWWTDIPDNVQIASNKGLIKNFLRDTTEFQKHDIVHINYASFGSPALLSRLFTKTPYVFTFHYGGDPSTMSDSIKYSIQYSIEQSICLPIICRFGKAVSVSDYNSTRLPDTRGSEVVYNGGSPSLFGSDSTDIRERFDISREKKIILFTGKLHGFKDGETVIDGFAKACQLVDEELELVLATGSGGYDETTIHDHISNHTTLADNITIAKDITDSILKSLYEESDVFVFPSYAESFGIVFLEAMEAGTPIVHSDQGAAPEIVSNAGLEIEAKNSEECAEMIVQIVTNKDTKSELINRGHDRRNDFSWNKAAHEYYKIYENLVK
ncbi:glycosyltransferase family 4 protein [Haloprofundus marisrubri]|uniref:glycosyltransferase family 4 protein n=1 Tax=Haloprofundus marisrubri TaxID=1514971 RepID=UPI0009E206B0|nr:glycosyltransferase family 4 protein [Haloprofundus marisrubri]